MISVFFLFLENLIKIHWSLPKNGFRNLEMKFWDYSISGNADSKMLESLIIDQKLACVTILKKVCCCFQVDALYFHDWKAVHSKNIILVYHSHKIPYSSICLQNFCFRVNVGWNCYILWNIISRVTPNMYILAVPASSANLSTFQ